MVSVSVETVVVAMEVAMKDVTVTTVTWKADNMKSAEYFNMLHFIVY